MHIKKAKLNKVLEFYIGWGDMHLFTPPTTWAPLTTNDLAPGVSPSCFALNCMISLASFSSTSSPFQILCFSLKFPTFSLLNSLLNPFFNLVFYINDPL
jgi:hypothetical protein